MGQAFCKQELNLEGMGSALLEALTLSKGANYWKVGQRHALQVLKQLVG
jgi:hypothetical protein